MWLPPTAPLAPLRGCSEGGPQSQRKSGPEEGATLLVAYLDDYFPTVVWRHVQRNVSQGAGCLSTSGLDAWKFYAALITDEPAAVHRVKEIAGHWVCPLRGNLLPNRGNLPAVAPDEMQNGCASRGALHEATSGTILVQPRCVTR